jgi:hypothetical protein
VTVATVVLCPPLPGDAPSYDAEEVADLLIDDPRTSVAVTSVSIPDPEAGDDARTRRAHWVAHIAMRLATEGIRAPTLLVLGGAGGALAPAVGFSQKASRRAVAGYVLVDAATPRADARTDDWPDAPVHYLASPGAEPLEVNQARLRGWTVHEIADLHGSSVAAALSRIVQP